MIVVTPELVSGCKRLGAALHTIGKTALILELPEAEFRTLLMDKSSDLSKAYFGGREETTTVTRESIIALAARGSSQAQEMVMDFYRQLLIDEA